MSRAELKNQRTTGSVSSPKGLSRKWRRRRAAALVVFLVSLPFVVSRTRPAGEPEAAANTTPQAPEVKPTPAPPYTYPEPNVMTGKDGWLFYGQGVDYVAGQPFLDPGILKSARESSRPRFADPRTTILNTREQFRKRGVTLILLPVPDKATIYPEKLWGKTASRPLGVQNPSFDAFKKEMTAAGVKIFDPTSLFLLGRKQSNTYYFSPTDTHWTPKAIQLCAWGLATVIKDAKLLPPKPKQNYRIKNITIGAPRDLVDMGGKKIAKRNLPTQSLPMRTVRYARGGAVQPDPNSDVLILGDSCAGSYRNFGSDLAAQLAFELDRPVDAITVANGGSWAARYKLRDMMFRGADHLKGKKVIIWEFVARDLSSGDWMPCNFPPSR